LKLELDTAEKRWCDSLESKSYQSLQLLKAPSMKTDAAKVQTIGKKMRLANCSTLSESADNYPSFSPADHPGKTEAKLSQSLTGPPVVQKSPPGVRLNRGV
jgi:hypothetical protein